MTKMKVPAGIFRGFFYLGCTFVILSFGSTLAEQTRKYNYNYAFEVSPVESCPNSEKDWKAAAKRVGCNETNGYHCAPDRFHTTLIEFCYNKPRILVQKGNCIELAASGILNHVKCGNFISGCPNEPYLSDEIYKNPGCLEIAFKCFTSDRKCLYQTLKNLAEEVMYSNVTSTEFEQQGHSYSEVQEKPFFVFLVLFIIVLVVLIVVLGYIIWKRIKKEKDASTLSIQEKEQLLLKKQDSGKPEEDSKENSPPKPEIANKTGADLEFISEEDSKENSPPEPEIANKTGLDLEFNDLNVQGELESEIYFEDIYLSLLMRRHCRNGAFKNFEYLLNKKIVAKKDQNIQRILTSRDKDGRTLLHCAAEGGCKDIFMAIMIALKEIKVEIKIDDTTHCGHTVLHLACKNDKYLMCVSLLSDDNNVKLLLERKSNQGWNAAHFAAASGNIDILDLLENKNLDINSVTENGLNVLDIACIHNHTEMCEKLIGRKKNPQTKIDLEKSDARGWAIDHFVAMVGNKKIFNMLKDGILKKTKRRKTVLHICCEYGRDGLCENVLEKCKSILHDVDTEGWNALHYAAKGGNLRIYKQIEKVLKRSLCATTNDGKTVLHVACINNRVDICRYICSNNSYRRIINSQIKTKKWTAAHYVAVEIKKDGAEEELISLLVQGGIDLKALTSDRLTVLGVACEHRNKNLIKYLLENHFELVDVETTELLKAANETDDEYICSEIQNAIEKYKERR